MQQLQLFQPKKETRNPKHLAADPPLKDPTPAGKYMSIYGLIYSLEPVEGWLDVKWLKIYRCPEIKDIAERAWVDPDTIRDAWISTVNRCAWGFGPAKEITRYSKEMASFFFVDPADYDWVEKILARKREEHNRNFELKRETEEGCR